MVHLFMERSIRFWKVYQVVFGLIAVFLLSIDKLHAGDCSSHNSAIELLQQRSACLTYLSVNHQQFSEWVKFAKQYIERSHGSSQGLSDCEIVILNSYLAGGYYDLNAALWNNSPDLKKYVFPIKILNIALSKLPNYKGTVYRHVNIPPKELTKYRPGAIVAFPGFTSTTRDLKWIGDKPTLTIHSLTGKDVQSFAAKKEEAEVLFRSGLYFKVIKRVDHPDGSSQLELIEIPGQGHAEPIQSQVGGIGAAVARSKSEKSADEGTRVP